MGMPMAFNARSARDARATIQFCVSGAEPGDYWLRIADGKCESFEGVADRPDLTVHTPDTVWLQIAHGKLDGAGTPWPKASTASKGTTQCSARCASGSLALGEPAGW